MLTLDEPLGLFSKYSLEWVHAQTLVHAGAVGEECSQRRLEDEAKVQRPVAHSLVHDRVTSGLADDQIGPLHHHNRHEERGVAGELEALAVPVGLQEIGKEIVLVNLFLKGEER